MKNITIAGNVTKDAEVRQTQNGSSVTSFSIAVNYWDGKEKQTMFFDISMWGKRGENVVRFAKKGAKMTVTGDFSAREYNGKTYMQVNASDFTPMGSAGDDYRDKQPSGQPSSYQAPARNEPFDEIPF